MKSHSMKARHRSSPEQWSAALSFWGAVVAAVTLIALMTTRFWTDNPSALLPLGFWEGAIACCQRILASCHLGLELAPMALRWMTVSALTIGFLYAFGRAAWNLWRTRRFLHSLRVVSPSGGPRPALPSGVPHHAVVVFEGNGTDLRALS